MNRDQMLRRAESRSEKWDFVIIGGGATGMGIAVDAASRGYEVLLIERSDFGKGTSSRSTKLVHGGVRYLQQGNVPLVMEALRERELLVRNAGNLVKNLPFIVPSYEWWEKPYYGTGLKIYSLLAGRNSFGGAEILSRNETLSRMPSLRQDGLRGGVQYHDGQFDDSRLLISLARTAADQGATLLNYAEAVGINRNGAGRIEGVAVDELESGTRFWANARVVINATGPFCDSVRRLARPEARPMVAPSQGIHLVVDGSFLPGERAIMIPRTADGRVMFAIPWQGHTLLGTTDTPIPASEEEPAALESEIEFVLGTASRYFNRPPQRMDVLSVFAGIRPLIRAEESKTTAALARDHRIQIEEPGFLTITGGKWTTYRHMSELCVDEAVRANGLPTRPCVTRSLPLHTDGNAYSDKAKLHPALPYVAGDVVRAVREEMARTIEDVLARRLRALFLNARAAIEMCPAVAAIMARELTWDGMRVAREEERFLALARRYVLTP